MGVALFIWALMLKIPTTYYTTDVKVLDVQSVRFSGISINTNMSIFVSETDNNMLYRDLEEFYKDNVDVPYIADIRYSIIGPLYIEKKTTSLRQFL